MTRTDFVIFNSHVTVIIKIYRNQLFLYGKTEQLKIVVFFPTIHPCLLGVAFVKQENC